MHNILVCILIVTLLGKISKNIIVMVKLKHYVSKATLINNNNNFIYPAKMNQPVLLK